MVLSVLLRFTDSHYPFGIFWSLCCLFFLDLRILITPLVSFVHCVVCSSQIYGFSLPLWYLFSIVLSVLLRFTNSHYPFGIFCPLCFLFFLDLRILITHLVSFGHCVFCSSQIYGFSLPLWYLLSIVLSVLLRFTDSHYPFGIFWPLCCLFLLDLRILITPLVSFVHCVVCSSQIYGFSLPLWYLLSIVLSVLRRITDSHYPRGIFCPLCFLFFLDLRILITPLVSFVHCVVCSSQIYGFSLPIWYLLAIVFSVLLRFTDSHYPFGIFLSLCCLFFLDLRILITPLVSFVHCVVCSSQIYGFSLPLWYLLSIVLSVLLRFTDSHYPFGIFCPLCCLFFLDLRILITPLVSFVHCVVCSSQIYGFSLPIWYLLSIVFSVLLRFTDSHYPFGIFWPLCFLFFLDLRILITPLVSFCHCVVCSSQIYGFSLPIWYLLSIVLSVLLRFTDSHYPLWYLLVIVLSVLLKFTDSHYPFGIFCPLCCLFFLDLRILIIPLVSFVLCVVCSSSIYEFSLPIWCLLSIVFSVLLRFTDSHYPFGIFWPLCFLFFLDLRILITPLVSFCHCVVCSSQIYGFSLPLWYLLSIVLSVLLRFTDSHYPFGIFWPLCCLFFLDLRILITPLVSFGHCVVCSSSIYGFSLPLWYLLSIVLSVLLRFTDSHYPFGIFCPLCCLFFFDLRILITLLVSFGHCVVSSSQIYGFSLPLWYLLVIVLSVLLRFTDSHYRFGIFCPLCCLFFLDLRGSHYPFGIFCPLCCLFFFDLRILITSLVSFGHCVVCSSQIYGFSLPIWYHLAIVFSVLLRFKNSHYPFGIFCPLCFLFFLDLRILITHLVSFGHCVFCSSQIYGFSLPLWYLFVIVLSVLLRFTDSHYPFGIFCPWCCLFFLDLRILITPLVSFGHCVVCSSQIYGFSLPLWYLLSIVLSVLLRFTDSHYPFGIFFPLFCLFFFDLRILITHLVSFVHCVFCSSQIYGFSLPIWYLLAIVFSVLLRFTDSHYPFGIFCPLCCLFFLDLRILITPVVSFVHCVFCSSQIYGFSLPLWYLLSIVLSVLLRFTDSHYPFGIFCPLCFLFFLDLRILITHLVSFGHCVFCSSQIYGFSLPLWYLFVIVLSVLLRFTDSHYPFGIFCPLCCLFFLDLRILITPFGIFWSLCCLFFLNLRILITPLVSFVHCVVCSSQIYGFSLSLWYLLSFVLSVLLRFTNSHYPFGVFCPLCFLFFLDLRILITHLVSFGHCVFCSSQIYGFSLPLWYLFVIVLSVLLRFTDSYYPFGFFCPLCCLFFFDLRILITPLVSFGHCVVCSSQIYGFSLPLWYLLVIVLSVLLRFTDSHYRFGIFCPLCCLFFLDLRVLITPLVSFVHCVVCSSQIYGFSLPPLVSFGHCVVCSSQIYGFSLPLWYLLSIVLSVLLRFTDSHYPLVSFVHCVVCSSSIYGFSLPLWYLFVIVLSVLLRFTDSHYPFGFFCPLCCLFFFDLRILITLLVSFGHCVVSSSQIYGFSLPLWYLLVIVLSVLLRFTDSHYRFGIFCPLCCLFFLDLRGSHYPFGIFCPLCCLFFFDLRILITSLVSFGHCVVCSSQIYGFSLPIWYHLAIVFSVLLRFKNSHYPFGIFCPLCFLFFLDLRILITHLVSFGHCVFCSSQIYGFSLPLWYLFVIVLSVLLRFTDSHYPFGIFCPWCCLFFLDLRILITPLVSFGHCVVCSSQIYGFSLPLWYLLSIVLSVLLRFTDSHYPFGIFFPLFCLFFFDLRILITHLVSFVHCVFCSSQIYGFSLPIWYLLAIVFSVLLRFTDSHYPFGIFCPLCCLFFFDLRILITPLVSFGHCVVCSSQIYGFSLPLWYLLSIVLSVLLRFTGSHYPFGIFCPLCCLFFLELRILITPVVSFVHCVFCSSQIYGFSLPLWYLLSIVLSVLLRFTDSHYPFGIFWPLCFLFFLDLRILITPLVSFCHCVVCSSQIYGFSLPIWYLLSIVLSVLLRFTDSHYPLWYLLVIVLSVLLKFTDSHYPFGIFCPLCCLFFLDLRILIIPLVSFVLCVVCSSSIYEFSLPIWCLLSIVFSVLLRFTDSHYPFGIFWPLCFLFFLDLRILITPLVSFFHCFVCSSSIYGFSLPFWYLLAIVLSVPLRFTDSHYPFGIFWSLCCLFFFDLRILITALVSFVHCVVCSSQI